MDVEVTNYKRCSLVKAVGRIDSASAPQLGEELDQVMARGQYKIVLDLKSVDFISSSGLRVLVTTLKNCRKYNRGDLILARVPERVHAALDMAGFLPFLKIFDDVTSAVGHF
ncbi:MAG TPA: STAS domain-containing protein [Anaerolineaceae bacterium]|nr:STAS domain-containing protein [Anaerolineaceae bacterium]